METKNIIPAFSLNETVLIATFRTHEQILVECPECNGDKFVTIIAGRNPAVTVACENCKVHGFAEFSRGTVTQHVARGEVETTAITGIEIRQDGTVEYRTPKGIFEESRVFVLGSELAKVSAVLMAKQYNEAEASRHERKHRHDKSWAWNASYYRKEIKDAERRLEYSRKALDVAGRLAKELRKAVKDERKASENNIA